MNATLLTVSDGDKQFQFLTDEYMKRINSFCALHTIKPVKFGSTKEIVAKETQLIRTYIEKFDGYKVLLTHKGKVITSESFATMTQSHEKILFVVGGAYGVNESEIDDLIDRKIALGAHTMPHGLVKVVLLEQLWRAWTISVGKKYHY